MKETTRVTGVGASEGVAVGPVFVHTGGEPEPERQKIPEDAVEEELGRFRQAVEAVVAKLSETAERLEASGSEEEAAIFEAHVELAEDPELASGVEEHVRDLQSPEAAVLAVGEEYAGVFAAMEDEYMAARADDVRDVASQIAAELMGSRQCSRRRSLWPATWPGRIRHASPGARPWRSSRPRGRGRRTSRSWRARWASPPWSGSAR